MDNRNLDEDELRSEYDISEMTGGIRGKYFEQYHRGVRMSVEELRAAVSHLRADEFAEFSQWFEEYVADRWDRKIEADIRAGRLDAAGQRADEDFDAGRCSPLP